MAKTKLDKAIQEAIGEILKLSSLSLFEINQYLLKPMKSYYEPACAEMIIEEVISPSTGFSALSLIEEYRECDPGHITLSSLFYFASQVAGYRLPNSDPKLAHLSIDVDNLLFDPQKGTIILLGDFIKNRGHISERDISSYFIPYNNFRKTLSKEDQERIAYAIVSGDIRKAGEMVYNPTSNHLLLKNPSGDYTLNTYHPPSIDPALFDQSLLEEFLSHVEHIVGKKHLDYFLKWVAYTVLRPGEKLSHAILLTGAQGSGKSLIGKVISHLCGEHNTEIMSMENFSGGKDIFNKKLSTCTFMLIEEAYSRHNGKRHNFYNDTFKERISQDSVDIRKMQTDGKKCRIWFSLFMTSNARDALPLEDGDRRVFVIHSKARDKKRGIDTAIKWNRLMPALVSSVYQYLKTIDITNFRNELMPNTDDRDEMMDAQSPIIKATRAVFKEISRGDKYKVMREVCESLGLTGPVFTNYFLYQAVLNNLREETLGNLQSLSKYHIKQVDFDDSKRCILTLDAIDEINLTMERLGAYRTNRTERLNIAKKKYHIFFMENDIDADPKIIRKAICEIGSVDNIDQFEKEFSAPVYPIKGGGGL
jgi:hypothetical protein